MEEFGKQDSCMMTDPLMGNSHHFLYLVNPRCIFGFMIPFIDWIDNVIGHKDQFYRVITMGISIIPINN